MSHGERIIATTSRARVEWTAHWKDYSARNVAQVKKFNCINMFNHCNSYSKRDGRVTRDDELEKERKETSMGSTSWAMMTSWAFFCSTRLTMVLMPLRTTSGRLLGWSGLPAARSAARFTRRVRRSLVVSGRYLSSSLNSWLALNKKYPYSNFLFSKLKKLKVRHSKPERARERKKLRDLGGSKIKDQHEVFSRVKSSLFLPLVVVGILSGSFIVLTKILTGLSVQSGGELVDGWWHFESLEQDGLLALQAHVLGPFDEACQITLGLNVLTYSGRKTSSILDKTVANRLGVSNVRMVATKKSQERKSQSVSRSVSYAQSYACL